MATLKRVMVAWTTGPGGPGLSVFYCGQADDVTTNLATFLNAIKGSFDNDVTWSIPAAGDTIESSTGVLNGGWSGGTAASITGSGSGTYAAGTGGYVRWLTGQIRQGRKFQGRTFLAPVLTSVYDNDGTITSTNITTWQTAATTLAATGKLIIWGRPTTPGGSDGYSAIVSAAVVPDKVTSLRSRRS